MSTFHTIGIVLSVKNSSENDRRAHVYTREHGKLELFAKSARRIESKLSPHLEPLTLADCYVVRGRIDHLAGIERVDRFSSLRESLGKLTAVAWAAELIDTLTKPDHTDSRVFNLLHRWITHVERTDNISERSRLAFCFALFNLLGYSPECGHCVKCKITESDDWLFNARDGGIICGDCRHNSSGLVLTDAARAACFVMRDEPSFSVEPYRAIAEKNATLLLSSLLAEHLDRPLVAEVFLANGWREREFSIRAQ